MDPTVPQHASVTGTRLACCTIVLGSPLPHSSPAEPPRGGLGPVGKPCQGCVPVCTHAYSPEGHRFQGRFGKQDQGDRPTVAYPGDRGHWHAASPRACVQTENPPLLGGPPVSWHRLEVGRQGMCPADGPRDGKGQIIPEGHSGRGWVRPQPGLHPGSPWGCTWPPPPLSQVQYPGVPGLPRSTPGSPPLLCQARQLGVQPVLGYGT